jgi:hypothetical protein
MEFSTHRGEVKAITEHLALPPVEQFVKADLKLQVPVSLL